jgi:serine/threonine-protein kinase
MKNFILAIASFLFLFTIQSQTLKTLSKATYSIKYPDTWTLENGSTSSAFSITAPSDGADDQFVENINLTASAISGYTPQSYATYSKTFLPSKIKNFKVLEEKAVTQGGKTGYYLVFKGKQGKDALKWKQYYFIEKGKVYILTFTAEEINYAGYIKNIGSSLNSFSLK